MTNVNGVGNTNNLTPMQKLMQSHKANKTQDVLPLGQTNVVKSDGLYESLGLKLNPEARMAAEMEKSPFIQGLNELFGII